MSLFRPFRPAFLLRFASLVLLACLLPSFGLACSCMRFGPPCEAAWLQADAVFVGRVYWTDWRPANDYGISTIHRVAAVRVLEPFVGNESGWVVIETGMGGSDCGYDFDLGGKYLIYCHRGKNGSLITSICTRTQKFADATDDLNYLRTIKSLPDTGRLYGTVKQYTFDPNFKAAEVSIMSPYGGPEEKLMSMRALSGIVLGLKKDGTTSKETTQAGPSGDFAFEDLVPGKYQLSVDLPPRMKPWEPRELIIPAKGCSQVSIRTAFNGRLTGKVTDMAGAGIPYAPIEVVRASEAETAERSLLWVIADKYGGFEIGPLPPDEFVVGVNIVKYSGSREWPRTFYPGVGDVRDAKRIRVHEGQLVEGLNFPISQKPPGRPGS